jgi:hypothetical protein
MGLTSFRVPGEVSADHDSVILSEAKNPSDERRMTDDENDKVSRSISPSKIGHLQSQVVRVLSKSAIRHCERSEAISLMAQQ